MLNKSIPKLWWPDAFHKSLKWLGSNDIVMNHSKLIEPLDIFTTHLEFYLKKDFNILIRFISKNMSPFERETLETLY